MLKTLPLAARLLWREVRSGQWFIVFFALLLAITAITGMRFYSDRLMRGLDQQSAKLLGGDLVISSPVLIPAAWEEKAASLQLRTASVWLYPSVVSTPTQLQLVNLQAVSATYPLLSEKPIHVEHNTAWVEPRLLSLLSLQMNGNIKIGAQTFQVRNILPSDINMINVGLVIAPHVMIRLDDVAKTKTVLPGSRVEYRLLIAGDKNQIETFRQWLKPKLTPSQKLLEVNNQQFVLKDTLARAENYIQLVLLMCLLMSGVAITISVRQYIERHYAHIALWRCLGAQEKQITQIIVWQLLLLALAAGLAGILIGYLLQNSLAQLFKSYFQFPLPPSGLAPVLLGLITSVLLLFSYAYPVIAELPHTSPLYIWRKEIKARPRQFTVNLIIAVAFLLIYILWMMDFSLLALFFLDALLLSMGFLYALSLFALYLLRKILPKMQGSVRRGMSELVNHAESVSVQLTAFTLIVMSLLVLAILRNNLIEHWQTSLPKHAPNFFIINIAPADVTPLQTLLKKHAIQSAGIYPMVRGRLTALNDKPIMEAVPPNARGHNALHRELNLSAMLHYPSDNKIVSGKTWNESDVGKPVISVATKLSDELQFKLGDKLTFQMGDQTISATISNIRSLEWESFHPNFYVIFPPGVIDRFPSTSVTSFYLQPQQTGLLNQLVQQFPNITVIDIAAILQQAQDILDKIILALRYLFYFALGAGILIFITTLQASQDERNESYHLLRVLGASKKYIYKSLAVEFIFLAILILLFGMGLAKVIAYLLMQTIFSF